jgi:hypothetical protein
MLCVWTFPAQQDNSACQLLLPGRSVNHLLLFVIIASQAKASTIPSSPPERESKKSADAKQ